MSNAGSRHGTAGNHPAGKHGKKTMEQAVAFIKSIGRCGSQNGSGAICSRMANHIDNHRAQHFGGGANDGQVYSEWGW